VSLLSNPNAPERIREEYYYVEFKMTDGWSNVWQSESFCDQWPYLEDAQEDLERQKLEFPQYEYRIIHVQTILEVVNE
jgi:hypothetical protein